MRLDFVFPPPEFAETCRLVEAGVLLALNHPPGSVSYSVRLVMVWLRVLSWAGIFLFLLLLRLLLLLLFTIGDVAQSVECVVCNDEAPGSKPGFSKVSLTIIPALASDRLLTSKHRLFFVGNSPKSRRSVEPMTQIDPSNLSVNSNSQIYRSNRSVKLIGQIDRSNRSVANRSNQAVSKSIQHSLSSREQHFMSNCSLISVQSKQKENGAAGFRSPRLMHANHVLYHLSYAQCSANANALDDCRCTSSNRIRTTRLVPTPKPTQETLSYDQTILSVACLMYSATFREC